MNPSTVLITTSGRDRPGVTAALFAALAAHDVEVLDVEQVVIHGRLIAGVLLVTHGDPAPLRHSIGQTAAALGMEHEVVLVEAGRPADPAADPALLQVIVLGRSLRPGAIAVVCQRIADAGGNIVTVTQLSRAPMASLELTVEGNDPAIRTAATTAGLASGLDIAVQRAGLSRRAKRLVVLDLDAILVLGDGIEELAGRAGTAAEARSIAESAHRGEREVSEALVARLRLLAGLSLAQVRQVRDAMRLPPGLRILVHTLRRLGYAVGVVYGGCTVLIEHLVDELRLDFALANVLEVAEGRLTGSLVGEPVDPAGKARALRRFAAELGVPLAQTVAISDGADSAPMLQVAGLGVAFNSQAAVQAASQAADPSAASQPVADAPRFLDALLHLLGISRSELEAADLKQV
jgi:phosphoserine phosphatase